MTDFTDWFADEWQRLLEVTEVPGMPHASWDRKAAYLTYKLAHEDFDLHDVAGLDRFVKTGTVNAPETADDIMRRLLPR